jgi:hypothetical protein
LDGTSIIHPDRARDQISLRSGERRDENALIEDTCPARKEKPVPRRPAKVTQADIARAIRAAKDAGASEVTVDSEGVIRIALIAAIRPAVAARAAGDGWIPSEALQRYLKRAESG